jgi:malate dehydrogenase
MNKVGIIGSGNAGANAAFFIAERGVADVLLYDIKEGLSKGKSLDLMEVAPVRSYRSTVAGTDSLEEVLHTDILVITAGSVRTPDMKREDLFEENLSIVRELAKTVGKKSENARVIVVTEPVDIMTAVFTRESKLPRERVVGVGGLLDSTRLRYAVARDLDVAVDDVSALVIGRHNEEMIGLSAYTTVSGVPVLNLIPADQFLSIMEEVRAAGDFIVSLSKRSTAYYAPSAAIAEIVDALVRDTGRVLPVSIVLRGEYDIEGVAMSVPAVIGEEGVNRVLLPRLEARELEQLQASAGEMTAYLERST